MWLRFSCPDQSCPACTTLLTVSAALRVARGVSVARLAVRAAHCLAASGVDGCRGFGIGNDACCGQAICLRTAQRQRQPVKAPGALAPPPYSHPVQHCGLPEASV